MKQLFLVFALAVLAVGCTTLPVQNKPLKSSSEVAGYRFRNIAPGPKNSDSLLVVLTFSGGGTRAASLAYGVLEKLRDADIVWEGQHRRLLDEVDVISSVSGGSLPAAYYGLFGDKIFDDFPEKVLYRNIQGTLLKRIFALVNIPKLLSPTYGRTDLMADEFNREIFDKKTFGDLVQRNKRPFIIINSTDVSLGRRFSFTQQQFDLLDSDLGSYPVSHAVAASAAFPGLLTPMTLRNFPKDPATHTPAWLKEGLESRETDRPAYKKAVEEQSYILPGRPYIHLIDGGVSDNLGLLPVIEFMNGAIKKGAVNPVFPKGSIKKVVIIVVNAERAVATNWDVTQQVLGLLPVLSAVSSIPIGNFTDSELGYLLAYVQNLEQQRNISKKISKLIGKEKMDADIPELANLDIAYHAIDVEFARLDDPQERKALNDCPTSFKLSREQVDRLRAGAGKILDNHPEFQRLLAELR
jgi:predicted acylesterase/phospholipase RssA